MFNYLRDKYRLFLDTVSPEDHRDFLAKDTLLYKKKHPDKLDLRSDLPHVRSQGRFGTCSAFTAAAIKEWQERHDPYHKLKEHISTWFIYNHRSNKGEGMHARDTMNILLKKGSVEEKEYSYKPEKHNEKVPKEINDYARMMLIKKYARVLTIDELKQSIYENGPCYGSLKVYSGSGVHFWRPTDVERGGHAVAIVGYNKEGFILRNSWGDLWNGNGYVTIPYDEFSHFRQIWTAVDDSSSNWENVTRFTIWKRSLKTLFKINSHWIFLGLATVVLVAGGVMSTIAYLN